MWPNLQPPKYSTLTCPCGASLTLRAFTHAERMELSRAWLAAHKDHEAHRKERP